MAKKNIKRYTQLVFGLREMNLNGKRGKTKKIKTVFIDKESQQKLTTTVIEYDQNKFQKGILILKKLKLHNNDNSNK